MAKVGGPGFNNTFKKPAGAGGGNFPRRGGRFIKKNPHRINEEITGRELRVVGEGLESSVMSVRDAIELAK